jgi:protein O-GlcNAc transferase
MNNCMIDSAFDINHILAAGIKFHQSGQLAKARDCYARAIDADPENPNALHLMGLLAHHKCRNEEAADLIRTATRKDPTNPHYHNDLGAIQEDLGLMNEALASYRKAFELQPDLFEAANNIGNVFYKLNRPGDALAWYQKSVTIQPDYAEGYVNIGNIVHDSGQLQDAIGWYQQALKISPDLAAGHHHLGLVYKDQGLFERSMASYQKALALAPTSPEILCSMGNVLRSLEQPARAMACYQEAIEKRPEYAEAYTSLGSVLKEIGKSEEAIACLRKALAYKPDQAEIYNNLGNVLQEQGDLKQAILLYEQATRLKNDLAEAHFNLGNLNKELGSIKSAIQSFRRAVEIQPDYSKAANQLVFQSQSACCWEELEEISDLLDDLTLQEIERGVLTGETPFVSVSRRLDPAVNSAVARSWSRHILNQAGSLKKNYTFQVPPSNHPRLRIGYISNDFRDHPIAHLILGLFGCHDRKKFEIFCYSHGKDDGSIYRKRIEKESDKFIDLTGLGDGDAADRIYRDRIDILVDLMGYTRGHRLIVSALRPAPLQVSFLGFPGTTGAGFFDYIIVDRTVVPKEHEPYYSEKLVYLPHCYQVNDGSQAIASQPSSKAEQGLPEDGFVFCAFHQSFKIDPIMFRSWMNILSNVPGSVLWLMKYNRDAIDNLRMAAEASGIDPPRLVFASRQPKARHLERHRLADLMLDTRIYNGHTTTSDALWAGVPVVAMIGSHFASRVSASILTTIGMPELIARTPEEYEELAVRLATDATELKSLRIKLANNRTSFPLFDTRRYARNLENAFIRMWHLHAMGQSPLNIEVCENHDVASGRRRDASCS